LVRVADSYGVDVSSGPGLEIKKRILWIPRVVCVAVRARREMQLARHTRFFFRIYAHVRRKGPVGFRAA
jgi:hypothetical protein